ncbi:MAG: cytochrome c oxidase subunit II [Flavobacteriales bacterium]
MVTFLIILSIALAVLAVGQLMRVFEATSKLRGDVSPLPTDAENKYQSRMMIVLMLSYFGFFIWLMARYGGHLLPISASEHGETLDTLLNFNFWIIILVFFITHIYLFYFAFKYVFSADRKAYYYTHSNKLELLWTLVPAAFLAVIIVYGLSSWIDITGEAPKGSLTIELYPKQFDWTARYAGSDTTLGASNYNMISATNPLGLITKGSLEQMTAEVKAEIAELQEAYDAAPEGGLAKEELEEKIAKKNRQLDRINSFGSLDAASLAGGDDDILVKSEFVIPRGKEVSFKFRSRDVIHSAYMPHFRAQMNCVPGMVTSFHFKPTITTAEMKEITQKDDFEYILLCNKICGAAHYNMQMTIKVVEPEEFNKWMAEQKTFAESIAPADETTAVKAEENGNEISMIAQ